MLDKLSQFDPQHVQITKQQFAAILGRSASQLDALRKSDPRMPPGYRTGTPPRTTIHWRLSEAYAYSELLLSDANTADIKKSQPPPVPAPVPAQPTLPDLFSQASHSA